MRALLFAANWKMHLAPPEARDFIRAFRAQLQERPEREYWFFPPAVSLETTAAELRGLEGSRAGAQDVHWEPKGAFTGATSVPLAKGAGATAALIGHSERRWVFGETDAQTALKLTAVLAGGLRPVLCVGEKLEERERGETIAVVERQLRVALEGRTAQELDHTVIAYEPVWAIGTGRNATPADAAAVHIAIRAFLRDRGASTIRILYGGSVNRANVESLIAEPDIDGVLVGGASLDPIGWARICGIE
jgi:triosephosphate isomerase